MIHANDISESGASVYIEMSNEAGDQFVVSMLRNMMGIVGGGVTDVSKRAEEKGGFSTLHGTFPAGSTLVYRWIFPSAF